MAKQYIVDGNLNHDNRLYKTGDPIVLEDKEAEQLLAVGRIKDAAEVAAAAAPTVPQEQPQQTIQAAAQTQPEQTQPAANQQAQQASPAAHTATPQQPKQPTPEEIAAAAASEE